MMQTPFLATLRTAATALALASTPLFAQSQPTPPAMDEAAVRAAWADTTLACRKAVQETLVSYGFTNGPVDGLMGPATLEGIKRYVAAGEELEWNTVTRLGALGLIWHMGSSEPSCDSDEIQDL
jgi:hypothetical protein